jgi:hypothetical protein
MNEMNPAVREPDCFWLRFNFKKLRPFEPDRDNTRVRKQQRICEGWKDSSLSRVGLRYSRDYPLFSSSSIV